MKKLIAGFGLMAAMVMGAATAHATGPAAPLLTAGPAVSASFGAVGGGALSVHPAVQTFAAKTAWRQAGTVGAIAPAAAALVPGLATGLHPVDAALTGASPAAPVLTLHPELALTF
jgi:hypothetical protein